VVGAIGVRSGIETRNLAFVADSLSRNFADALAGNASTQVELIANIKDSGQPHCYAESNCRKLQGTGIISVCLVGCQLINCSLRNEGSKDFGLNYSNSQTSLDGRKLEVDELFVMVFLIYARHTKIFYE